MKRLFLMIGLALMSISSGFSSEIEREKSVEREIRGSYSYVGLGLGPLPAPAFTLSVGKRLAFEQNVAMDAGVSLATLIRFNALRAYVNGLCYINLKPDSQYYVGLGGSIGGLFGIERGIDGGYAAPNVLFGKEFLNWKQEKRFFQVEVLYPIYSFSYSRVYAVFPLLTVKYGIAF